MTLRVGSCLISVLVAALAALAAVLMFPARPAAADQVRDAQQPVLRALNVTGAWRLTKGAGVTVALLDSGVGSGAPDLSGSVTAGPDLTAGVNPAGYQPPHLHGTYMASLIAGHGHGPGGGDGVVGVAPRSKILSVRVLPDDNEPGFPFFQENTRYADTLVRGIRYAVGHHASVINMSLGGPATTVQVRAALAYAVSHGVVVVAAAGNEGTEKARYTRYTYPGSYPGLMTVAAVTVKGQHASFSGHNASVVVSAPGVNVVGAGPGEQYLIGAGTSQATALVSGIAALIRARFPGLAPALVRQAIIGTTTHRPRGGYNTLTGFGVVNAAAAVREAATLAKGQPASGMADSARVGGTAAQAPVEIINHSVPLLAGYGAAAVGGLLGCVILIVVARRASRAAAQRPPAIPGPAGWPGPPGPVFPAQSPGSPHPGYPPAGPPGSAFPPPGPPGPPDPPGPPGRAFPPPRSPGSAYPPPLGPAYPGPPPGREHPGPPDPWYPGRPGPGSSRERGAPHPGQL